MKNNKNHTDFEKEFFAKTNIQYSKSKEDVWLDLDAKLSEKTDGKVLKVNFRKIISYSAAAVLVIGLGIFSFLKFYSISVYCPNGQHSAVTLPDGSKVTLNANSELSYHPYWWKYSREIDFNGEAFFEVTKGEKFTVVSEKGTTTVLGTSFNIFARENNYKVYCITGKVKVEVKDKESVVLTKDEYSIIKKNTKTLEKVQDEKNNQNSIAWIKNEFIFTETPLKEAYEEIERQFDIIIEGKENLNKTYSGSFKRGSSPEEAIIIISKPFGIKHRKVSNKRYIVKQ